MDGAQADTDTSSPNLPARDPARGSQLAPLQEVPRGGSWCPVCLAAGVFAMTCRALPVLPTCRAEVTWLGPWGVAKRRCSLTRPAGASPPGLSVGPRFQVLYLWVCFSKVPLYAELERSLPSQWTEVGPAPPGAMP